MTDQLLLDLGEPTDRIVPRTLVGPSLTLDELFRDTDDLNCAISPRHCFPGTVPNDLVS
ncbi:hypothetical protein ACWD7Y_17680 [Streptomyces drozdowiczii]